MKGEDCLSRLCLSMNDCVLNETKRESDLPSSRLFISFFQPPPKRTAHGEQPLRSETDR